MSIKDLSNVRLIKFTEFDEADEEFLKNSLKAFFSKVGGEAILELSLKDYAKGGVRVQHEVKGNLKVGSSNFFAEEKGWKLISVISKVLAKLERSSRKDAKQRLNKKKN